MFTWYPLSSSEERYLKTLQKYPLISTIKRVVPAAVATTKGGIEVFIVDEVKRAYVGEVIDYLVKFLVEFRDIEGFRYQIRTLSTLKEAMAYIGK